MLRQFILATVFLSSSVLADTGEIYMANEAGGWLTLTHEECKTERVKKQFPWHAYGTEANGTVHNACYVVPSLPTAKEQAKIPQSITIFPVVNIIDLEDGQVHTLRADWFTSTKPRQEETY